MFEIVMVPTVQGRAVACTRKPALIADGYFADDIADGAGGHCRTANAQG